MVGHKKIAVRSFQFFEGLSDPAIHRYKNIRNGFIINEELI